MSKRVLGKRMKIFDLGEKDKQHMREGRKEGRKEGGEDSIEGYAVCMIVG